MTRHGPVVAADGLEGFVRHFLAASTERLGLAFTFEVKPGLTHGRASVRATLTPGRESKLPPRRWMAVAHALQGLLDAALTEAGEPDAPVELLIAEPVQEGRPPPLREDAGLVAAARALAESAARLDRAFALGPMSVIDRRQVHQALSDLPQVWTQSEGEGIFRRLWIVPRRILAPKPPSAAEGATDDSVA